MINNNENSAVKIAVRERPFRDHLVDNSSVINYHPNGRNIFVNESLFTFDHVLGATSSQSEIFDKLIKPLVVKLKIGCNCTALAYGQTGTGKSYTMGLNSKSFKEDDIGVIPRTLKEIFSLIGKDNENGENSENIAKPNYFEISVSFIEIYNEKVYDLLGDNTNEPIIAKGYKFTGGTRKPLNSLADCYTILMQGNKNRHVRPTKMNSQSSRSHAIFTIHVRSFSHQVNGKDIVTSSCMNIVDLAGSEGVRRTGHQGMAMSEGVHINQGLLSIGKVLQAMTSGCKVIPFRDSVLSSVLQESLNSNSYLTLLACVSPHREDLSETLSTLRFAQSAKQLKNVPEINNIMADIKKNIKQKQTPLISKSIPLKNSYSSVQGTQTKSTVKSNTFCTPEKRRRIQVNKCNKTEIFKNRDSYRPKLSNAEMNLPKMNQMDSTHIRGPLFDRSLYSNGTLLSLNVSTSRDSHAYQNTNFSPIIRKCMTELKNDFEENILKIVQQNLQNIIPATPAPKISPRNQTVVSSTIRQELKTIIKEVLFENSNICNNVELAKTSVNNIPKRQLFNKSEEIFKIPEIPFESNRLVSSSPIDNAHEGNLSFSQTMFSGTIDSDTTVFRKSIRRSIRISEKTHDQLIRSDLNESNNANKSLRRSSRKSVLQTYQNKRQCIRLAKLNETVEMQTDAQTLKKNNKAKLVFSQNITLIDNYCNGSENTKTSLTKHRKAVLDLLNKGSMKNLQILPQIGQKTAYQIITHRTLSGKFKNWTQVEKLPIWRGTAWKRFAEANMLM